MLDLVTPEIRAAVTSAESAFAALEGVNLSALRRAAHERRRSAQAAGLYRDVDPDIVRAERVLAAAELFAGTLRRLRKPE